jgi:CBS domain containing-hemolysin-like protein
MEQHHHHDAHGQSSDAATPVHGAHDHPPVPLNRTALSATVHCLTGCAIGEVLGMVLGTVLGLANWTTVWLSVFLAFFFGYSLTMLPLVRRGIALKTAVALALASDTASIMLMEIMDNAIMLFIPGAMDAGLGTLLFWGSLAVSLVIAGVMAFPLNRWLIRRGLGHAVIHAYH